MKFSIIVCVIVLFLQQTVGFAKKRLLLNDPAYMASMIQLLETKVNELNFTVANLKAAYYKDVSELRAALSTEKLERCRTGLVEFHHEECATGTCQESHTIQFNPPFSKTPIVTFSLNRLDVAEDRNLRVMSHVSDVTSSSATLTVETWADTILHSSGLSWIACPQ